MIGHVGPVLYAVIGEGVAPALATGGDTVEAAEAGMKYLDWVGAGLTDSGKYRVEAIPTTRSGVVGKNVIAPPGATYRLRWVVVASGAEAAAIDLSAEIVRLFVLGPK